MDLEYAERAAATAGGTDRPEVWLSAAAPPDAVARLTAAGLVVLDDETLADRRARLDRQGSAVSLRFHLVAAALAVLLGAGSVWLVAAVDRRRRGAELRVLRVQGVPARVVASASRWGYLGMALAALLLGPLAAGLAWWAVGDRLPVFVDEAVTIPVPAWPHPGPVVLAWLVAATVLLAVSTLAARAVRRAANEGGVP
jgi:predicted lysophospholipase L1 biosynthesis ABC-type transport system permease subunit